LLPKFNCWILLNKFNSGLSDIIEETRILEDEADYEKVLEVVNKIKIKVDTMSNTNFIDDNDDDLGSDFDDVEKHAQDTSKFKVKTGIKSLDEILSGGLDCGTINFVMAETSGGKSFFMQNLAVSCANLGYNVAYLTLEMSERKTMKRLGSMRLKIPLDDYDTVSMDTEFMQKKIKSLKCANNTSMFEKKPVGKIFTKFWSRGTAGVKDFDNYINKIQIKKNIKIDLIIIDYFQLVLADVDASKDLYTKGRSVAEGCATLGVKYMCPIFGGLQVSKDAWNAKNISLSSVPDSKAYAETADTFFVIIRNEEMKKKDYFYFKSLKHRDGKCSFSSIKFGLSPDYLTIEDQGFVELEETPIKKKQN
jgi:replicative DNA helicase